MPSSSTGLLVLKGTGAILMLHAAYSCMHYRSILLDLDLGQDSSSTSGEYETTTATIANNNSNSNHDEERFMIPPLDVYIEVAMAFVFIFIGELIGIGPLQSVELASSSTATTKHKPLAAPAYKTRDFDIYSNRSKALVHRSTAMNKND